MGTLPCGSSQEVDAPTVKRPRGQVPHDGYVSIPTSANDPRGCGVVDGRAEDFPDNRPASFPPVRDEIHQDVNVRTGVENPNGCANPLISGRNLFWYTL